MDFQEHRRHLAPVEVNCQAVAQVMRVPLEDVQVSVSESPARRLSTRLTVQAGCA